VALRRFDRKFGADLVRELPAAPAVYLFKDERGEVLYAGKAKNIRRRLRSYRNATRRKSHRKMRTLVREASSLEVRLQPSEREALLLENQLIRTLRPRYNVDGSYAFLYPAIGVGARGGQALLCFTTRTDAYRGLGLRWYGSFRSRLRARDAFDALVDLLSLVAHREPRTRLPRLPRIRGSRLVGFRRLEPGLLESIHALLAGDSRQALAQLALHLVERPSARRDAPRVQEDLLRLDAFCRGDVAALRAALRAGGRRGGFVPQAERDALFIAAQE
jgi:excinuclease ABC subunit C